MENQENNLGTTGSTIDVPPQTKLFFPPTRTVEEELKNFMFIFTTSAEVVQVLAKSQTAIVGIRGFSHEEVFEVTKQKPETIRRQLSRYHMDPEMKYNVMSFGNYETIAEIFEDVNIHDLKKYEPPVPKPTPAENKKMAKTTFITGLTMAVTEWIQNESDRKEVIRILETIK